MLYCRLRLRVSDSERKGGRSVCRTHMHAALPVVRDGCGVDCAFPVRSHVAYTRLRLHLIYRADSVMHPHSGYMLGSSCPTFHGVTRIFSHDADVCDTRFQLLLVTFTSPVRSRNSLMRRILKLECRDVNIARISAIGIYHVW